MVVFGISIKIVTSIKCPEHGWTFGFPNSGGTYNETNEINKLFGKLGGHT
jgi:hypothetical protein